MKQNFKTILFSLSFIAVAITENKAQITILQDYKNYNSPVIGTFQNISFREAGFSGLYPIANSNGTEFWTVSDRGVNVDAKNANPSTCRPTYDKIYAFPSYAPKIHRIRLNGDSIKILQTTSLKRPGGAAATGIINPTGFGSTAAEVASTDTVLDCANFNAKTTPKDIWGIDSEGIVVDKDGNFWICEEGGPTIWKVAPNGVVIKRYTPYANLPGAQPEDVAIDTIFKYRKNNRGFEGISIAPNGKVYAIIQSPILYPSTSVGENTRVHRILEIDPTTNAQRMFVYLNDGIIGSSGSNQIRLRDWKIGDMVAINNNEFLVIEAALRGTSDIKRIYKIDISNATNVTSALYSGVSLEALVDQTGLTANNITPVTKTLFMDLLANGWNPLLDKAEGLAIINDSTIAIGNDNDYGQTTLNGSENGIAVATTNLSHVVTYRLSGANKIQNYKTVEPLLSQGIAGPSTIQTPYLQPTIPGATFTSILSAGETVGSYKLAGLGDGLGAYDNNDGTFTLLMNHEIGATSGAVRAHGSAGAFVSKWVINKNNLSVVSGSDLIQSVKLWNGTGYTTYNSGSPMTTGFGRFCSADLPAVSAFYNAASGKGTQERIFMNGEESGPEGRMFAHIATGTNAGVSYELPYLGKFSSENNVACPSSGDKTVVVGMDDATPGQVYFYIGTKTNTGTEIEKAGLSNGKLYGVSVSGLLAEVSGSIPSAATAFSLVDLGQVQNTTGAALNTASNTAGVTTFLRPEDGAWDPSNPNDFYFVTTNSFTSPSRLWKLHFTNVLTPELGGTITAVLDGTEGPKMMDNLTIDNYGHILIQEDPGNQTHLARVWQYTIATDALLEVGTHDANRFITGAANFLTQDEESSGIIDMQEILGAGKYLLYDQAHYNFGNTEIVEGGQLLAYSIPVIDKGITGPSTVQGPYLQPTIPGATFTSILSAGESVGNYKLAGIGDGLGAYDNNDGTFTLLMNHELGATTGVPRAHGSAGAFVSKWVINKNNLSVVSGSDLIQSVKLWNGTGYTTYNSGSPMTTGFGRFCSADLPAVSAFYNAASGKGTQERIFMNGEESGPEGRMFAHIATGTNAGVSYELPYLGKFSSENNVACPSSGDKTVVVGMDDATPGQVYFYIGTKTNTGTEIEKAGLTGGKLYGVAVSGLLAEVSGSIPAAATAFTLVDLGQVQNTTGAALNTASNTAGVTTFLRPEDGAWDPSNPNDFYFVTTNSFTSPSRLWKLHFTNVLTPELGGTITAVLDGTEGPKMMDNLTIDNYGHILIQEDPGNQTHLAKVWQYTIATDALLEVGTHDANRFITGAANFLTQDEESSGIIDMQEILGAGKYLLYDQAHYNFGNPEIVEGGQLLAFYNPATYYANPEINISGNNLIVNNGDITPSLTDSTDFGSIVINSNSTKTFVINNEGPGVLNISAITMSGTNASEFTLVNGPTLPLSISANASQAIKVKFIPAATGVRNANIVVNNNDFNEPAYSFAIKGNGLCTTPTADISVGNTSICPGDSVELTSTYGSSYLWSTNAATKTITVKAAGTYTVQVTDANGCTNVSSPITIALFAAPTIPTISVAGAVLTSTTATSYQWYLNGSPINGATNKSYTTTQNGNYKVVVKNSDGCEAQSAVFNFISTGLSGSTSESNAVSIYPNPYTDFTSINVNLKTDADVLVEVFTILGDRIALLANKKMQSGKHNVQFGAKQLGYTAGVYFVKVTIDNNVYVTRVVEVN